MTHSPGPLKKIVIEHLEAATAEQAVREIARRIADGDYLPGNLSREKLIEAVLGRESQQTTGLGNGLAFPHARIAEWQENMLLAIAFSDRGIDFASVDGRPVHAVFLMVSSTDEPYAILQTLSSVAQSLSDLDIARDGFDKQAVLTRVAQIGAKKNGKIIYAADIMLPVRDTVSPDMSVEEVAHLMHVKQLDVVPVVDNENRYCGEISSLHLFQIGMPEFFKNLPTISFVRHIDPFEKYFHVKADLKAKDIMTVTDNPFTRDRTLLEIIFELTVKKRQRIFILDDHQRLEGMVDRFCILDKILFF